MASRTLSETESKRLLAGYGVPIAPETLAASADEAVTAADALGYPVVAKLNGEAIAHKTERGLVRLGLGDADAVRRAAGELLAAATPADGDVAVLIAPMVRGNRELIAGVVRDPQFGPTVMLGVGGILAEAVADVVFRPAPVDHGHGPRHDRPARHATPPRRVPRRAGGRPGRPRRDARRPRARGCRARRRRQCRRQPADRDAGRFGGRRRRAGRGRRRRVAVVDDRPPGTDGGAVPRPVRTPRRPRRRGLHAPRQVRLRVPAQPPGRRLRGQGLRHQPAGGGGARHPHRRRRRRAARR